jgi:hypothetical protein
MSRSARIASALALFVVAEIIYVATTCPTYFLVDCPELNAAAAEWGVPHPPGYPLYTMLGGPAIRLLPFGMAPLGAKGCCILVGYSILTPTPIDGQGNASNIYAIPNTYARPMNSSRSVLSSGSP